MLKVPYINLSEQHKNLKEDILKAIAKVLDKADFILGEEVEIFEKRFAEYCGTNYAVAVNSGTDALFLALKVLGITNGDEVITVPNSFIATASTIIAVGATPVFVDVKDDMNINPELIEAKISTRTKAILPVHLTGKPCDISSIMEIAKKHNLFIVEDAAQSVGSEYNGKKVGSFGNVNCFSLHPLKTLNACGDGGVITTDDESLYNKLLQFRNIGLKNRNEADFWGYNSRLDTIQAAILNIKLSYLDEWINERRRNADYYIKNLTCLGKLPLEESYEKSVYHTFIIQVERRNDLQKFLLDMGIETKIHYPLCIHLQKAAKLLGYKTGDFIIAERQSETILSLPVYQGLMKKQLKYVVDTIKEFYKL